MSSIRSQTWVEAGSPCWSPRADRRRRRCTRSAWIPSRPAAFLLQAAAVDGNSNVVQASSCRRVAASRATEAGGFGEQRRPRQAAAAGRDRVVRNRIRRVACGVRRAAATLLLKAPTLQVQALPCSSPIPVHQSAFRPSRHG